MWNRVLLYVFIMSMSSDASPGHLDILLTQYKASGYFPGPVLHSVRLSVMFQCYELCGYFPRCVSISWNPGRRECHLHNTTGTVLPDQNWVYIDNVSKIGNKGCSSSTCPGKLCIPLSARGHLCVAAMIGDKSNDRNERNTAKGTSMTHHVAEIQDTTLSAAVKIEPSLSDTLMHQVDESKHKAPSSAKIKAPSTLTLYQTSMTHHVAEIQDTTLSAAVKIEPSLSDTLMHQVDESKHKAPSSAKIKAPSTLTLYQTSMTHHVAEIQDTTLSTAVKIEPSLSDTLMHQVDESEHMAPSSVKIKASPSSTMTLSYQTPMDIEEAASYPINTEAPASGASADTQVTTISDHTSAATVTAITERQTTSSSSLGWETGLVKVTFSSNVPETFGSSHHNGGSDLPAEDNDRIDKETSAAFVTNSRTSTRKTTPSRPDVSTTTLSPKMLKRSRFLQKHSVTLRGCSSNFIMPFDETLTCADKTKTQRNGGSCNCKTGLHFNPYTNKCVLRCRKYGRAMQYQSRLNCIDGHNDRILKKSGTVTACTRACLNEASFVCRSFDIFQGVCYLSRSTRLTVPKIYWIPYCGCKYFQRTCAR